MTLPEMGRAGCPDDCDHFHNTDEGVDRCPDCGDYGTLSDGSICWTCRPGMAVSDGNDNETTKQADPLLELEA